MTTQLINHVSTYLRKLSNKTPTNPCLACFSGEFDSNQTKFEEQSNHLQVGVIADNEADGKRMLAVLRVIIDRHLDSLTDRLQNLIKDGMSIDDAFLNLEDTYFTSYPIDSIYTVKLTNDEIITSNMYKTDLWTATRLWKEFKRMIRKE